MNLKKLAVKYLPIPAQNLAITSFNTLQYNIRHGGEYREKIRYYEKFSLAGEAEIIKEQHRKLVEFLDYAQKNSKWYSRYKAKSLADFPVLEKKHLIENLNKIATVDEKKGIVRFTGGTTGTSMKVIYTSEDVQDRHAILDYFRSTYGYKLGEKVAWFTGKDFLSKKDIKKNHFHRDDYLNKIRFFSTYHINESRFHSYWKALKDFQPKYIVGFPSSVHDLCVTAHKEGLKINSVKVFFPTAETVQEYHRNMVGEVLGCRVVDQYASSEGAPFILECSAGTLHMHTLTGVFEVVDENMQPAKEGELLVTAFATRGTPLIRYRIGDRVKLAKGDEKCSCGSSYPIVEAIQGRATDFLLTPENGRVRNLSVCTKGVEGIMSFQLVQNYLTEIDLHVVPSYAFTEQEEAKLLYNVNSRLGGGVKINLFKVNGIMREKSGKFRLIKNNLSEEDMIKSGYY